MDIVQASMVAVPVLLVCAGVAFLVAIAVASRMALLVSMLTSSATLLCLLCLVWFFRDGLGPDAVTSQGMEAASRIAAGAAFPAFCWLLINGSAYLVYRLDRKRSVEDAAAAPPPLHRRST